jgi:nucleotide-binding universal stress UspA family protein
VKEIQKSIVVPVDFSGNSENIITEAILLSKQFQSKIHLVNVIEFNDWWNNIIINKDLRDKLNEMALQNIKSITEKYDEINFESIVLFGRRHEQILTYAESINAIFIVLYDKHKDENESKILGSTVTHIITESKCPVITIKNKTVGQIKNIIVPIDLSDNTDLQLNAAIEFNKHTSAHLHFVSVLFRGLGTRNIRIKAKALQLKSRLKDLRIPHKVSLIKKRNNFAYQDILEFSNRENADLIIIMTHKENYSFDTYIGAFAHQIVNLSDAPVMTITSKAAKSDTENIFNTFVDPLGMFEK